MATYIFQGGTANNIWGHSGNWNPNVIPTGADDAVFNALSPTCGINTGFNITNLDCTNYGATMTFLATNAYLAVGNGMTLGAGMKMRLATPVSEGLTSGIYPQTTVGIAINATGGGTRTWTTNGVVIPFVASVGVTNNPAMTLILNGTCTIQGSEYRYDRGGGAIAINGSPLVLQRGWHWWRTNVSGSSDFIIAPPVGATVTLFGEQGTSAFVQNPPMQLSNNLILAGQGDFIHWAVINKFGGTMTYVSGGITTQIKNGIQYGNLETGGGVNIKLGNSQWSNLRVYGNTNFLLSNKFGNNANISASAIGGSGTIILNGANTATCNYLLSGGITGAGILINGAGTRDLTGASPDLSGGILAIAMIGGTVNMRNTFTFSNNQELRVLSPSLTNSTLATFQFSGPTGSPSILNAGGITVGTGIGINNSRVSITSPVFFSNLRSTGNFQFSGSHGWTTANFTHPGNSTITLGTTGTYNVTTNFQMVGTNATGGRAVLQSDTRADFIGNVSGNSLVFTSGTAPFIGGELGIASYTAGQSIPQGFAVLLPGRPVVVSQVNAISYAITPAVNPPIASTFSVGKKARFFLGTGATQNVIWASTRDIDSLGPGVIYQTIFPQFSFNDSSGVTGPTLLRTLNWGTLAPPTRPAAFTFVT